MIRWAIKNRKITLLVVVLVAVMGLYSYMTIPKQENPAINAPFSVVTTIYPGASPEDVKELVTDPIEDKIREVSGVDKTQTQSRDSASIITIQLDQDANVDETWEELYRILDDVQDTLPKECLPIDFNTDLDQTAGMIISLSSQSYDYDGLETFADTYIKDLSKIDGIASFDIVGAQEKQIQIEVDIDELNLLPLSLEDISNIVASQNVKIPAGQIDSQHGKIAVNTDGTYQSIEEIENIIVYIAEDGSAIRLKNIAIIAYVYKDDNFRIQQNGVNGILLTAYFKEGQNVLAIGDEVKDTINSISQGLPKDLVIDYVLYQPDDVKVSLDDFMANLIGGIIIVILVVFMGLGFRNAIIVSVAIPLSMMVTFVAMPIMGIEIHNISIVGLIIALGMLVDNAIVVSDAIQVYIDEGRDRLEACVNGVKQVAIPVLTSTLTTIGTFIALLFLGGVAGDIIVTLPKILIVALTASYVIALFVTPTLAYIFFQPSKKKKDHLSGVRKFFERLLKLGIRYPKRTIAISVLGILSVGLLLKGVNLSIFPIADNNILAIDIYPEGIGDIEATEALVEDVEGILEEQEEVVSYTTSIGGALPKYYYTQGVYPPSLDFAQLRVQFDLSNSPFKKQQDFAEYIQQQIKDQVIGGKVEAKLLIQGQPIPPLRYIITGDDLEIMRLAGEQIKTVMVNTQGTKNVRSDYSPEEYQFYVDVNPAVGMYYGISKYDVQKELSLAVAGRQVSTFISKGEENPIVVKGNMNRVQELHNFQIKSSMTDKKTPVGQVADINLRKQTTNIKTYNQEYAVIISSDIKQGYNASKLASTIEEEIDKLGLEGITVTGDGEKANMAMIFGDVGILAFIAVVLVYGVLLLQFKSYLEPLLICLTLPLACIGSIFGLFITRQELSFTALIGMVSLIGIVVNNAIVLLDFIKLEREGDKTVKDACMDAVEKRFRPIILSSFTTIMGLIPLALSGSVMFVPMSIALIFGILISTLLTLVFFPVIYYMTYKGQDKKSLESNMEIGV